MKQVSRRDLLRMAGVLAIASAVPFPLPAVGGVLDRFFRGASKLTPPITSNEAFYVTSYLSPPTVRVESWGLSVKG
ncbi:MAG: twin-arginine translocation signal domain-containing protein, partial [Nitrospiraceae bacterium]